MHSRNIMIKEQLTLGHPVQFRCLGGCMHPTAHDKDCCIFEPVVSLACLKIGDIVFCQTEPNGDFLAGGISEKHPELAKLARSAENEYGAWLRFAVSIERSSQFYNCYGCKIYGRLVEAVYEW